jgi:hypothetical protein
MKQFKVQGWFQVPGYLFLITGSIPPLKGGRGMCLIYWFLVTGYWFQVERNLLCQFIHHCEEARRSNPLIILLNGLLHFVRNDDTICFHSSLNFNYPISNILSNQSNCSLLTTPY